MRRFLLVLTIFVFSHCGLAADQGASGAKGGEGEQGISGTAGSVYTNILTRDSSSEDRLHVSLMSCDNEKVSALLDLGADVNHQTRLRNAHFYAAILYGCDQIVKEMFDLPEGRRPNLRIQYKGEGQILSFYEFILFGSRYDKNNLHVAVYGGYLGYLELALGIETRSDEAIADLKKVLSAIESPENKYSKHPSNVEAAGFIRQKLSSFIRP